ncbi:MAG: FAD-binding protein [Deltaproteobacteria bacterium]|nr:FAD-binding protein [Deltaproteobacteria bacterium]
MRWIRLDGLAQALDESEDVLKEQAARALGISVADVCSVTVIKKALDARRNKPPHFVYAVKIGLAEPVTVLPEAMPAGIRMQPFTDEPAMDLSPVSSSERLPVAVVGSGPAGLFAAYVLAIRGLPVLLLERGRPMEERTKDVRTFWEKGVLDPQSNVLFGEGGAGTFSDGKLTSRTKNPYAGWVKKVLVEMGAPRAIMTDAKPHIGTDRLREVLIHLRRKLLDLGCEIRFGAQVTDVIIRQGAAAALVVNNHEEIQADRIILAVGQNADDTYGMLNKRGVKLEPKPFAMGLRVEHPQSLINSIQYGRWSNHPRLPAAEYFVTADVSDPNRSVYTFCMCPGGQVIGCSASPGLVVTNGMSNGKRDGDFANSAVVVNVRTDDFMSAETPLSGLDFRRHWERKAYLAGGSNYCAPAQRLTDFVAQKTSGTIGRTSFLPGVKPARLADILPSFAADALCSGIKIFDKNMPGFISQEAHLIGLETRTSSPVRICRKADGQSENVQGLYPCGEGAGYAGGIISSALDGIKAAHGIIASVSGRR